MSGVRKKWYSDRMRIVWNIACLITLLALGIFFEVLHGRYEAPTDKCEMAERHDFEVSANAYRDFVTSGELRSHRVTVMPLRGDTEPVRVLNNVCEQRWYVAKLIQRLSEAGASVIVIDKFFAPESCPKDDTNTSLLISAIQASSTPIVVAIATHPPESDPNHKCLILSPSLPFGKKQTVTGNSGDGLAAGNVSDIPAAILSLSRLNQDLRKVPINWYVYESDSTFDNKKEPSDTIVETLSYQAAILGEPKLNQDSRLNKLRAVSVHPFTAFIESDSLSHIDALNFLCSGPDRAEIESRYPTVRCAEHMKVDAGPDGQVVVIGEDTPGRDRHDLFGKDVPGMYLQANYIESLMEHHYLTPLGRAGDIIIMVVWVGVLYLTFWLLQPELALMICLGLGVCCWFGLHQLVLWRGIYADVWVQSLGFIALLLKYIDARGHLLSEMIKRPSKDHPLSEG